MAHARAMSEQEGMQGVENQERQDLNKQSIELEGPGHWTFASKTDSTT